MKNPSVLVVSKVHQIYLPLTHELRANSIECYIANSMFYAGTLADLFKPDCVVLYTEIGRNEVLDYCRRLKAHPELKNSILIVIDPSSDSAEDWSFVDEYLVVNFDAISLTSIILDQLKKNGFYQVSDLEHAKDAQ